jgi:probable addiction module antidote protein
MKTTQFDVSQYLDNNETICEYMNAVIEENDPQLFMLALGSIAKAKGMSEIARKTGLGRESLYKAVDGTRSPKIDTVNKILNACGLALDVKPVKAAELSKAV